VRDNHVNIPTSFPFDGSPFRMDQPQGAKLCDGSLDAPSRAPDAPGEPVLAHPAITRRIRFLRNGDQGQLFRRAKVSHVAPGPIKGFEISHDGPLAPIGKMLMTICPYLVLGF